MIQKTLLERNTAKLRILCLGGWRTNAKVFNEQLNITGIRDVCKDLAEFVSIDATHLAEGPPDARVARLDPHGPYFQWWYFDSATGPPEAAQDNMAEKRVVWHDTEDNTSPPRKISSTKLPVYRGVDATLARLSDILSYGSATGSSLHTTSSTKPSGGEVVDACGACTPSVSSSEAGGVYVDDYHQDQNSGNRLYFDGIFGFSQGACCTALMTMLASQGDARFAGKFRFSIIASGFRPQVPDLFSKFVDVRPINVPSLHIMSEKDVLWESSRQLSADFESPHTLIHERGHSLPPAIGNAKLDFVHFLQKQQNAIR
eukprot:Lankesteria_metandrocarpae@DN3885_c0_g1_i1.p1